MNYQLSQEKNRARDGQKGQTPLLFKEKNSFIAVQNFRDDSIFISVCAYISKTTCVMANELKKDNCLMLDLLKCKHGTKT